MCRMIDNKRLSLLAHVATTDWIDNGLSLDVYWRDAITFKDVRGRDLQAQSVYAILKDENVRATCEAVGISDFNSKTKYDSGPGRMLDAIAYARQEKPSLINRDKRDLALQVLLICREYEHQCEWATGYRYSKAAEIIAGLKNMLCNALTYDIPVAEAFGEGWHDRYFMEAFNDEAE